MNTYSHYRRALALGLVSRPAPLEPEQYIGLYAGVEDPVMREHCYLFLDTALRCRTLRPLDVCRSFELPDWVGHAFAIKRECRNMTFEAVMQRVDVEWWNLPPLAITYLTVVNYDILREYKRALEWLDKY